MSTSSDWSLAPPPYTPLSSSSGAASASTAFTGDGASLASTDCPSTLLRKGR